MTNKHPYAFTRLNIPESYSFIARAGGNVVTVYMPLDTLLCKIFPGRREKKRSAKACWHQYMALIKTNRYPNIKELKTPIIQFNQTIILKLY